jgi:predicted AAA+ superfamily ATPase
MWLERIDKKNKFIKALLNLKGQVLIVRGARQVGKTSFILNSLKYLSDYPQLKLNLLYPGSFKLDGVEYFGRDFFGRDETGEVFLRNIELEINNLKKSRKPALIFIDEADRYPPVLESIQTLAEFSENLKIIITGSNLENISVKNAATGRKKYFDLYPITFMEFIRASGRENLLTYLNELCFDPKFFSEFYHDQLNNLLNIYLRIGGMPKVLNAYIDPASADDSIPEIMKDLVFSIEENIKTVLSEKSQLYEYEDILRKMAFLSLNTLKYNHLQVQHAGRSEAKKLVIKTVGARIAHKIRLYETETDLSKYIIFDCGIANFLLCGSDLLRQTISDRNLAILTETFVGTELIANLITRDDLFYWKSENRAEADYLLRSPFVGIDVKANKGDIKSLNSFAIFEPEASFIIRICNGQPQINYKHKASLPNYGKKRNISLVTIPHYLTCRLLELIRERQ